MLHFYCLAEWHFAECHFDECRGAVVSLKQKELTSSNSEEHNTMKNVNNGRAHIRHQCRETAVLSCHRCLINPCVEKMSSI